MQSLFWGKGCVGSLDQSPMHHSKVDSLMSGDWHELTIIALISKFLCSISSTHAYKDRLSNFVSPSFASLLAPLYSHFSSNSVVKEALSCCVLDLSALFHGAMR